MDYTSLTLTRANRVSVVTLTRAKNYNSFTRVVLAELRAAVAEALADDAVDAIVLTGTGRAFSAGQDLDELVAELDQPNGGNDTRLREGYGPLAELLHGAKKPIVAAVNGVAAGAGMSIACLCATRVASTAATFAPAFGDIGLVPDTGATLTVPGLIGRARALRWFADGRRIDASTALTWGLVDAAVEPDQLLAEAVRTASRLASRDRRSLTATAELVASAEDQNLTTALAAETAEQLTATSRPEFAETVRALRRR